MISFILKVVSIVLFFVLVPFIIMKLIYKVQENSKNYKMVLFLNAFCLIFFTLYGYIPFYLQSIIYASFSSSAALKYMFIIHFRNIVGFICGFIYSLFVNYRQMDKFLKEWKAIEQKENFIVILLLIEFILIFCFYKLCHIW